MRSNHAFVWLNFERNIGCIVWHDWQPILNDTCESQNDKNRCLMLICAGAASLSHTIFVSLSFPRRVCDGASNANWLEQLVSYLFLKWLAIKQTEWPRNFKELKKWFLMKPNVTSWIRYLCSLSIWIQFHCGKNFSYFSWHLSLEFHWYHVTVTFDGKTFLALFFETSIFGWRFYSGSSDVRLQCAGFLFCFCFLIVPKTNLCS